MLSTSADRLDANIITTANTTTWSEKSMISVRKATTTIRSTKVDVNNLTVTGMLGVDQLSMTSLKLDGEMNVGGVLSTAQTGTGTDTGSGGGSIKQWTEASQVIGAM